METSEYQKVVSKDQLKLYLVKSYAKEDDDCENEEEDNDDDSVDDDYDEERGNPSLPTSLLLSPWLPNETPGEQIGEQKE